MILHAIICKDYILRNLVVAVILKDIIVFFSDITLGDFWEYGIQSQNGR